MASWVLIPYLYAHTLPYPRTCCRQCHHFTYEETKAQTFSELAGEAQGVVCNLESEGCAALEQMLSKGWTKGKVIGKL